MLPAVACCSTMKDCSPTRMEETDHMGFHVSGWKSLRLKHSRVSTLNRPLGVHIMTPGGLKGYSGGNSSFP